MRTAQTSKWKLFGHGVVIACVPLFSIGVWAAAFFFLAR